MHAIHANVFPFNGQGAFVADVIERNDDLFEVDIAVAERSEIPIAAMIAEFRVATKHADISISATPPDVLHVYMVDAVRELADELNVVDSLIPKMGGVEIEAETLMALHCFDGASGGGDIESDLSRMNLQSEVDVCFVEGIQDRNEALGEILVALFQESLIRRRESVQGVPYGGSGKAVHNRRKIILFAASRLAVEELAGRLSGGDHVASSAFANTLRFAISPNVRRQDRFVSFVDVVADGLAYQVIGNGVASEAVLLEQIPLFLAVLFALGGLNNIEVVSPAGKFDAVVAHAFRERRQFGNWQVGPLAGE